MASSRMTGQQVAALSDTIEQVATRFFSQLVADIEANLPAHVDATRHLRQSIKLDFQIAGGELTYEIKLADYYQNVDKGQPAGTRVPREALERWIVAKSRTQPAFAQGFAANIVKRKGLRVAVASSAALKSAAFVVQRKIYRKGTAATNFYSEVVTNDRLNLLRDELARAVGDNFRMTVRSW